MRSFWRDGEFVYLSICLPDRMPVTSEHVSHVLSDVARGLFDHARDNDGRLMVGGSLDTFAGPISITIAEPPERLETSPEMPVYEDG